MFARPIFHRASSVLLLLFAFALLGCPPKYPKCKSDKHCAEKEQVCVEGLCQDCRDDSSCAAGQVCKAGRCEVKAECAQDADCAGGKVCKSGRCKAECAAASDCGAGLKCLASRCVEQNYCNGASDCASGQDCQNNQCTDLASRNLGLDQCLGATVRFEFNRSVLTGDARDALTAVAECIRGSTARITIEGHCDERGTEEFNLSLGEERARAVRKYLESLGVSSSKLRMVSKGELEPLDSSSTEAAWAKNRRAEFIVE